MAAALTTPTVRQGTSSQAQAAVWTVMSAAIALAATVPLVAMLAKPISQLMFVRGSMYYNDWGRAFTATLVILAPATYTLFFGTAGEVLKTRVDEQVHRLTMRVAAIGMIPYITMMAIARFWAAGPQESFMLAAALSLPIAMAGTIWASTQNH